MQCRLPGGENIQAWLAHMQADEPELAWRALVADDPFAAIHGRVCYHPCERVCNRANLDSAVSIHSVERYLGDLALERGVAVRSAAADQRQAGAGDRCANKNAIKILGSEESLHAQGYFVYDSKKSGSQTVSHLRFGSEPIRAPYLISQASFVGCHHFGLLERAEVLDRAAPGATLLLNCRQPPDRVWVDGPRTLDVFVVDSTRVVQAPRR